MTYPIISDIYWNRSQTPYTHLTWVTVTRNTHHNMFYLHILVTTYPDVIWWKNLQKEWKTTVHFFPECEKVNNRFTKKTINGIFWLVRIFWATRLFWRVRIFFTETFWIVKIFRTFRIFSCLRIFCVNKIFWLENFSDHQNFFTVSPHSRTSRRNSIWKKKKVNFRRSFSHHFLLVKIFFVFRWRPIQYLRTQMLSTSSPLKQINSSKQFFFTII